MNQNPIFLLLIIQVSTHLLTKYQQIKKKKKHKITISQYIEIQLSIKMKFDVL